MASLVMASCSFLPLLSSSSSSSPPPPLLATRASGASTSCCCSVSVGSSAGKMVMMQLPVSRISEQHQEKRWQPQQQQRRRMGRGFLVVVGSTSRPKSSGPAISSSEQSLKDSILEAKEACEGAEGSEECAAAWEEVEGIKATVEVQNAKLGGGKDDPLEAFCSDNPEAEECRVYEE
ncbi:unnamed protein product [Sphagnum troendelagicum]|uniref:CP12 domain-containing protein n=1 Tax=Sphagnum troendelagicum TaxID=128251 RepID=A0ABP0U3H2_9BRYO